MKNVLVRAVLAPVIAVLLALAVTTAFLTLSGYSAVSAYTVMWEYGTTTSSLVASLNKAVPLYLSAVAGAFAVRMGLFNIGVDGQYRLAALAGAVAAASIHLPGPIKIPLVMLVCCTVGALWALIPALLKVYRGVNEVITSILLNAVATTIVAILLADVFRDGSGQNTGTAVIDQDGRMPVLVNLGDTSRTEISSFVVIAAVVGITYYLVMNRSVFGFTMRVAAASPAAAESAGISVKARIISAMLISGAVAGLVGLPHVLGSAYRFDGTMPLDLMFTGLAATLLGRSNPLGMALAAFVLAFVDRASQVLGLVQLPTQVGQVFIAVILISSAVSYWILDRPLTRRARWPRWRRGARASSSAPDSHDVAKGSAS
ncbi:ABC transporter permease (plasmid) [Coraliomargarita sp. W4R53]